MSVSSIRDDLPYPAFGRGAMTSPYPAHTPVGERLRGDASPYRPPSPHDQELFPHA